MRLASTLAILALGCAAEVPSAELGTGLDAFEPLAEGQPLPMVPGAQGGFHLWLSVRAGRARAITLIAAPVEAGRPRQDLRLGEGAPRVGIPFVLSSPECFVDRDVQLELEVDDGAAILRDRVRVRPFGDVPGECAAR
ncbi:MAG: hypothetical protein VYE22_37485 [Myxococcota bacterium]|nr:hypothetical protein [Myxococcota bacterium]